jgi:hypothetical protein
MTPYGDTLGAGSQPLAKKKKFSKKEIKNEIYM